ncbi:outer membrane beta-barrel protein, partial [Parasediminibacterium sp. JCM 36343]|uniref:outer membrane beta-barrel protein n=1 Tax=Parasediminibacterium sp. JCM 36343 TaxID=3374279 RepID=UPI00397C285A
FNDTILNRIYTNASYAEQYGVETGLTLHLNNWWQCLVGLNVFESKVSGSIFNGKVAVHNSKLAYTWNTTQTFKLSSQWTVQLSASYLSLRPTAQGQDGAFFSPNLSIKKLSKNNQWAFQAQWLNIDAGMGISNIQRITTSGSNFYTTTNYIVEPDVLQLGVSYTFNKKNKKVKLPVSEIGEKEF